MKKGGHIKMQTYFCCILPESVRMRWLSAFAYCGWNNRYFASPTHDVAEGERQLPLFARTFSLSCCLDSHSFLLLFPPSLPLTLPPSLFKLTQHFHPGLYECAQVIIFSDGGRGGHYRIKGDKPQRSGRKMKRKIKEKRMRQGSRVILRIWDVCPGQ